MKIILQFQEPLFFARVVYDLLFFFIVIIIVLNLIFGVIIDTFADLRSEKQQKELILKNTCFICGKYLSGVCQYIAHMYILYFHIICIIRRVVFYDFIRLLNCYLIAFIGLNRSAFDNKIVSFEEHVKHEHNMWHYLYFIVLVRVKDPTEFTGPESYVYAMVKVIVHRA